VHKIWIIAIALVAGCADDPAPVPPECTFTHLRQNVLPGCTGALCHRAPPFQANLDLTDEHAYMDLVNVPSTTVPTRMRVWPGSYADSFMWEKLNDLIASDGSQGHPMPLNLFRWVSLPADQLHSVQCWIADGAKNN
jgi:hypothetical protein